MFVNSYLFPMFGHFFFKFVFGIIVRIWYWLKQLLQNRNRNVVHASTNAGS